MAARVHPRFTCVDRVLECDPSEIYQHHGRDFLPPRFQMVSPDITPILLRVNRRRRGARCVGAVGRSQSHSADAAADRYVVSPLPPLPLHAAPLPDGNIASLSLFLNDDAARKALCCAG